MMRKFYDLNMVSRLLITGMIAIVMAAAFNGLFGMDKASKEHQAARMVEIIQKALVQCYALEGSYPSNAGFETKMEEYGVILNHEKYIYHYEIFSTNVMPLIIVRAIR